MPKEESWEFWHGLQVALRYIALEIVGRLTESSVPLSTDVSLSSKERSEPRDARVQRKQLRSGVSLYFFRDVLG